MLHLSLIYFHIIDKYGSKHSNKELFIKELLIMFLKKLVIVIIILYSFMFLKSIKNFHSRNKLCNGLILKNKIRR